MSTGTDRYQSPLSERYASKEMQYISPGYEIPYSGESCGLHWQRRKKSWDCPRTVSPLSQMSRSRN